MKAFRPTLLIALCATLLCTACSKNKESDDGTTPPPSSDDNSCQLAAISASSTIEGYNILDKLPGIWNGPVYSPTPLGSYQEWIVDFRPISGAQVSAKNELDSLNDIFMSFFVVKYNCQYKMAFRNGGGFAGNVRNSYMIIDSVYEMGNDAFYRFADPVAGGQRVYTTVNFKQDSLIMTTFTNQYNSLQNPVLHMRWTANLRDTTSTQTANALFNYPQKQLVKDFSTTFDNLTEAVFYSAAADPYPEGDQPHLGNSTVNITVSNPAAPSSAKKILIIITTQPLFSGPVFIPANMDYRSRYVFVSGAANTSFNFNYMHPGNYYVNAIYDDNGDFNFSSGDYMNSATDVPLNLVSEGTANVNVNINFQVP